MNRTRFLVICAVLCCAVADAEDSLNVRRIGQMNIPEINTIAVQGNLAYVAGDSGLRIVDVSDPAAPEEIGFFATADHVFDVTLTGDFAYIADAVRLEIVDVTNPANPIFIGSFDSLATGVFVSGTIGYVTTYTSFRILDISNPAAPAEIGHFDSRAIGITVIGDLAYIAAGEFGLTILDVSNPAMPIEVGHYSEQSSWVYSLAIAGNYAYLADELYGVRIIDISDPSNPTEIGFNDTPGFPQGVAVVENFIYVADYNGGLRVIDVSNPALPIEVGFYDTQGFANGVAAMGSLAIVADQDYLGIYDCSEALSSPESPTITPARFELFPAYPNPFNAETTIGFSLPRAAQVELDVFDVNGRMVKELASQSYEAGNHSVNWNASPFATGVYFVRLNGAEYSMTQKMVLLK